MNEIISPPIRRVFLYAWGTVGVAIVVYGTVMLLAQLRILVAAVFIGLILTALVQPLITPLHRFLPTPLAVGVGLLAVVLVITGVVYFIVQATIDQWPQLVADFTNGIGELRQLLIDTLPFSATQLGDLLTQAQQWLSQNSDALTRSAFSGLTVAVEALAAAALGVFCAVCFLGGWDNLRSWAFNLFPPRRRETVAGATETAWNAFAGYTRGIVIIAAANAAMVFVLLIVLRVPLALPLSILVFLTSFVPLIGATVGCIVAALVAFAANGPLSALIVVIGIIVLQQIEGHVLQPLVMSRAVRIHPLAVALAVTAGTLLGGLIGAVIAVPVVSVIYGVAKYLLRTQAADSYLGQHIEEQEGARDTADAEPRPEATPEPERA